MPVTRPRFARLRAPLLASLLLSSILIPLGTGAARSAAAGRTLAGGELRTQLAAVKRIQIAMLREGARRRFERAERLERRRRAEEAARRLGVRLKPAPPEVGPPPPELERGPVPARAGAIQTALANIKVNNSAGDAGNATQSEQSVAALGDQVLVAWNDGNGGLTNGAYQGYATSTDGGATFVDGGDPPRPPGYPSFRWMSDPVVTVDEKTGRFYYCGLANPDASSNAIVVARGRFGESALVWDSVIVVRQAPSTTLFLDKQWISADSSGAGGHLYLSYTTFTTTGDRIDFQRSTDGGLTWSAPLQLSRAADDGLVQGSRTAVGPAGELYVAWSAIGRSTAEDYVRVRQSVNGGQSFGAEVTPVAYIANFGTGAPGFNRERGIHFPSLMVDRTSGARRGRVYLSWAEAYNFQDDAFGVNGVTRAEAEPNGAVAAATPFQVGDDLVGETSSLSPPDLDHFSFALAAGQSITVWADSLPPSQTYSLRILAPAPDSTQRLAYGGDTNPGTGVSQAFYTFTAPVSGTYTLRMVPVYSDANSRTGRYRIRTTPGVRAGERGRDQRDVFATWSADGITWASPARMNDDPVGFDEFLPEIVVGADGFPYAFWFDFRDDPFGSRAHQVLVRSEDGGATWSGAHRLTGVLSNWTTAASNLAPNMGDYQHVWSGGQWLHPVWADARDGTPDVYAARLDLTHSIALCAADAGAAPGTSVTLRWELHNPNALFANTYRATLADQRGWPLPGPVTVGIAALADGPVDFAIQVPDTAAAGINALTLTVSDASGGVLRGCTSRLTVVGPVAVGDRTPSFALGPSIPNPARGQARIGLTLPRAGRCTLRIYGLRGERVRTLVDAELGAGAHTVAWDGRDDRGRAVGSGTFFYRLEAGGQSATRRLVWVR
jgi:flagellar hook capping protein FlgD